VNINAKESLNDENSIFYYYKKLIQLRKTSDVIVKGSFELLYEDHPDLFVYTRTWKNQTLLVVANFYGNKVPFTMPEEFLMANCIISNYAEQEDGFIQPYEAGMYLIE
jgi:glycosidase